MGLSVDLNCDMGEGCGNDAALMDYVSSVNIACGFHAGDTETMHRTVETALEKGVAIGAHPGYRDRANFGRTPMDMPLNEVYDIITEQINILSEICGKMGAAIRHVKPHGALYNQAVKNAGLARTIAEAVRDVNRSLIYFGLSGSVMIDEAEKCALRTASEVFADRTYRPDASLTPRTEPNALIADTGQAVSQVMEMVRQQTVTAIDGTVVPLRADTICIHGDGENALGFARAIHAGLIEENVAIRAT